jgi:ectoine hydroxylase-related dioxygenase (phytanoyl-CoA dioxygenase family)
MNPHDMRAEYDREGFVVVRSVIPRADVLALRAYAESLVDPNRPGEPLRFVQTAYDRSGRVTLIKASGLAEHDARFRELATRSPLVDAVEALLGPGARRFRDVMVVKPGHTGGSFSYHQDSAYWDVEPKALVSCWVSLGDVSEAASCLRVVPGTHRESVEHQLYVKRGRVQVPSPVTRALRRLVSATGTGDNPEAAGGNLLAWKAKRWLLGKTRYTPMFSELQDFRIPPSAIDPARERRLPVSAGDIILFHSLLWHASGPNETDSARFAEIISFMGAEARFVGRGQSSFPLARTS